MSKERIEEMALTEVDVLANDLNQHCADLAETYCGDTNCLTCLAHALTEQGYRKQKEGHWFILEYEYFTCSECGYYHPNGCDSTKEAKEKLADGKVPKYCSECGAYMR